MAEELYTVYDADKKVLVADKPQPITVDALTPETAYTGWAVKAKSNPDYEATVPDFTTKAEEGTGE